MRKSGRIPTNLDLDSILDGVKGNKTRIQNLRDGIVYFISKLTVDNYNYIGLEDGYIPLNKIVLESVIGQKRPSIIVKLLKDKGVIEFLNYRKGYYSRKYRLTEKYNTGKFQYIEFGERIKSKIQEQGLKKDVLEQSLQNITNGTENKYQYVFDQFYKNNLDIDLERGMLFIKNLGTRLLDRTSNLDKYRGLTFKSILNYIGRMMNLMEDIHLKEYNLLISPTNNRFHSNLTSINKTLRPFLKINGQEIGEVDISSSQPYILSTILNPEYTSSEEEGYNLYTIYRDLFQSLVNSRNLIPSKQVGNDNYILGVYLNDDNFEELIQYTRFDFSHDFYSYILNEGQRLYPELVKEGKLINYGRDHIKGNIMNFLFEKNELNRESNEVIKLLNLLFPGLCSFIDRFIQHYTNRDFSLLLQRTESYLMLGNVGKKLNNEKPDVPFFTIHDSIVTTKNYLDTVKDIMSETITSITGKPLKVKSKIYEPYVDVTNDIVEETWKKVHIPNNKKYNKMKSHILSINIHKGMEVLIDENEREKWLKLIM